MTLKIGNERFKRIPSDKILKEYQQYLNTRDVLDREIQREFENLKIYAGVDNSMWPASIQQFLREPDVRTSSQRIIVR